jgi:hypothetical protein
LLARAQTGPLNSRDTNKAYAPRRTDLVPEPSRPLQDPGGLFLRPFGPELLEVGPNVCDVLLILDPDECHSGARHLLHWRANILSKACSTKVPALRPSIALSGGPSLILPSGPMSWQGEHNRLNTCSPAAESCANVGPVEAVRAIPAINHLLIISLLVGCVAITDCSQSIRLDHQSQGLFATVISSYVGLTTGEGTCCGSRAWGEMVRFLQFAFLEAWPAAVAQR